MQTDKVLRGKTWAKGNIKRIIALVLMLAFLMIPLSACHDNEKEGMDIILDYLEYIRTGSYSEAYELLASSSRNETDEPRSDRVTKQEFIDKYTSIFTGLEITDIEYLNVNISEGEILRTATFDAIYYSKYLGDTTHSFSLIARRSGGKWAIEWSPELIFPEMQWGDTVRVASISARRGDIMVGTELLATTSGMVMVYAQPSRIVEEDMEMFLSQVSTLLEMPVEDIEKQLSRAYGDMAELKSYYPNDVRESVIEQLQQIDGIGIDYGNYRTFREYPHGDMLAHIIGYVGPVPSSTEDELNSTLKALNEGRNERDGLYTSDSVIGRIGLESKYEQELRGKDGISVTIRSSEGILRTTLLSIPAQDGQDINLTIDLDLQLRLDEVVDLVLFGDTTSAAVIVMNPITGEIDAMASYPSYDLNLFAQGISEKDYNELSNSAAKPLYNKLTQGTYPPGSVFKVFTAAAALEEGIMESDYVFTGEIEDDYWTPTDYGTWIWPSIKRVQINYRRTPLNMRNAFLHSDNIYFANAALLLGEELFMNYMSKLGFEETFPFDINVSTPRLKNPDTDVTYKLLADSGYGQGEILMTPLQLATAFCAFANGGDIPVPRVVEGFYAVDGIKYSNVSKNEKSFFKIGAIQSETIETITPFLIDVARRDENGTARQLRVSSCVIAAKTGTAEVGDDKSREISWFAGYRTGVADEDARLVLVMLDVPAETSFTSLKFEIARPLLELDS